MRVEIEGVLADGSDPESGSASVPTEQAISIPAGVDVVIAIAIIKADGTALDITGYALRLVLRTAALGGQLLTTLVGSITSAAGGLAEFTLPRDTTRLLQGSYHYDVMITSGANKKDQVVPDSFIDISAAPGA